MDFPPKVGDKFKSIITGGTYVITKIVDKMVVLDRLNNKKSQLLTELTSLKLFYKREDKEEEPKPHGTPNFEKRRYPRFSVDLAWSILGRIWLSDKAELSMPVKVGCWPISLSRWKLVSI
jgi:hypothetical protein